MAFGEHSSSELSYHWNRCRFRLQYSHVMYTITVTITAIPDVTMATMYRTGNPKEKIHIVKHHQTCYILLRTGRFLECLNYDRWMLLLVCNLLFYLSFVASPFALQRSIGNKTWRYKLFHKGFKTPRRVEVIKSKNHGVSRILKYKDILRIVLRASKINCARNQVSNIMKPFFNFILIFRLRTKWRLFRDFQGVLQIEPMYTHDQQ